MKVAIYARYSSENQSAKSIDDQIRVCKDYASKNNFLAEDNHIYIDEAISGSIIDRPGLHALEKAAENKEFDTVIVDDLSRISRSNHQMLTLVLKFNYLQIRIISVSDGISTDDDNSKLGIHLRGLMNELYLDDLKKKTMRGLEGQNLRGFSVGENVFGYFTEPVGELRIGKRGETKHDGMVHKIDIEQANIVKRIFNEFSEGRSLHKIAATLNENKVPTKRGLFGGWNISSLRRILQNKKYIGIWVWKKTKTVRDPLTGKKKIIPRPEKEHLSASREDLIIIDQDTWDRARERWSKIEGAHPLSKKKARGQKQKSYVHGTPPHLFSGTMKCHCCNGPIVLVSGKGSGYYGCYNFQRKTCTNKLLVSRKRIEKIILVALQEEILTPNNVNYIYKNLEKQIAKRLNDNPEAIKKKKSQHDKLSLEIQNYLNYIKVGNFSKAVSEMLKQCESRFELLAEEIKSLEFQKNNTFKSPPIEWIKDRLGHLYDTLGKNTTSAALALKELLSPITLEPVSDSDNDFYSVVNAQEGKFKPYYVAHIKAQTLALLDEKNKGSNWFQWRGRWDSNPRSPA